MQDKNFTQETIEAGVFTDGDWHERHVNVDDVEYIIECNCGKITTKKADEISPSHKKFCVGLFGVHLVKGKYTCHAVSFDCKHCTTDSKNKYKFLGKCSNCGDTLDITEIIPKQERRRLLEKFGFEEIDGENVCKYKTPVVCPTCSNF